MRDRLASEAQEAGAPARDRGRRPGEHPGGGYGQVQPWQAQHLQGSHWHGPQVQHPQVPAVLAGPADAFAQAPEAQPDAPP